MARGELVPITQHREIVPAGERVPTIVDEVRAIQGLTSVDASRFARRLLFLWFRVYVRSRRDGRREERVDVRIPIPLPLVGALFPRSIGWRQALAALTAARESQDPTATMRTELDSVMAVELVRVENDRRDKHELVVVGFD